MIHSWWEIIWQGIINQCKLTRIYIQINADKGSLYEKIFLLCLQDNKTELSLSLSMTVRADLQVCFSCIYEFDTTSLPWIHTASFFPLCHVTIDVDTMSVSDTEVKKLLFFPTSLLLKLQQLHGLPALSITANDAIKASHWEQRVCTI